MSWLPAERADAAGLDANFIEPAVLRADALSKPTGGEGRRPVVRKGAGVDEAAQGALDAEAVQCRLLCLPASGKQFCSGLTDFAWLHARGEGAIQDDARRPVIPIHMRWRK